jgi:SNF2 family DNA or RNA helicase
MNLIKAFPEKKRVGTRDLHKYELPPTTQTADIINHFKDQFNGQFTIDQLAQMRLNLLSKTNQHYDRNAHIIAAFRNDKRAPKGTKAIPEHPVNKLLPFQKIARHCCLVNDGFALFMEQGTGKTPVGISVICNEAIKKLKKKPKSLYRVLIVCPKNVRQNWAEEFEKFGICDGEVSVVRGSALEREKAILFGVHKKRNSQKYSAVVTSYGSLHNSIDAFCLESVCGKRFKTLKWDLVILDESHYIKTHNAQRTKATLKIRDAAHKRMILTGTPITNSLLDLWSQLEFLYPTGSGCSTYNAFKEFYGVFRLDEVGHKKLVDFENVPLLRERLARHSFVVTKKEALPDLPDKVYDIDEVTMTPQQAKTYANVATQVYAEIENDLANPDQNQSLVIKGILHRMLKLSQVTSGFVKFDAVNDEEGNELEPARIDRIDPNPKLERLVEILKTKEPHQKTIIWCHYRQDIQTIAARLKLEDIECVTYYGGTTDKEREVARDRFNTDPDLRVFVGSAGAGGTGLNLLGFDPNNHEQHDTYCDHVIYYSQDWSPTKRSQSEDRCHRKGVELKDYNVTYTDLMIPGTIDQEIRQRVQTKREKAFEIQDVRDILEKLRNFVPAVNGD